jgi:DNA adenine methylase
MVSRPAMRYLGGKWRLAPWILSFMPQHRTYTEPFGGAASVLLRKPRAHAEIYNDLDGEIANLFRVLRSPTEGRELARQVRYTPFSRHEYEAAFRVAGDPIEQARRTLVKAAMGFGSNSIHKRTGFRSGHTRNGQIPASDWAGLPVALEQIVDRLRGVVVEERPALEVISRYDSPTTLHYIDPPYPHSVRGDDSRYRCEMTNREHCELATALHNVRGMVIVSGYACDLYDVELYADWQRVECNSHADGGRDRVEVLWISPQTLMRQPNLFEQEVTQ